VDTERASGYRYWQRAYLVQLRREGAGTVLIDPIDLVDLTGLADVLNPLEWVLHAASQDLPCLAELGLAPATLFDTELAARLAGLERVGLAALVEELLGYQLLKGHGAADWSRRPLPEEWLTYAALDVELLLPLRAAVAAELDHQDKSSWAAEEFEAVRTAGPPPPRVDPWRRTSGMHRIQRPRELAAVRELWHARDQLARHRDIAPGRVLPDAAIIDAALADPADEAALVARPVFSGRSQRRHARVWLTALERARALPLSELPPLRTQGGSPPPVSRWGDRDPAAARRLTAARAALAEIAEQHRVPVQNLLTPDLVRRLCWEPPELLDAATIERHLIVGGARRWQRNLTAHPLATALKAAAE
jgi:ribonuclease D